MKDSSKNKEWERRRRDRLNDAFKKLAQILPNYDPASKTPKIDILEKAAQFIKELRLSNSRLISQQTQSDEKSKLINELQDESNKLILRVKQLTTLLKQAKIRIPLGPALKIGKKQGKWSNQLTPENLENSAMETVERNGGDGKKDTPENVCQDKDGLTTNTKSAVSLAANSQPQSISVTIGTPLKETNTDKESANSATAPKSSQPSNANIPPIIKPIVQSVPLPTTTTIILTSCPIPNPLANQPVVTRMTIAPRILPKPDETNHLQKIAILPIRKPLPPKEKKRRNRAKKVKIVPEEPAKISKATNTLPVVPKEKNLVTTTSSLETSTQMTEKVAKDKIKDVTKSKDKNEIMKIPQKEVPEIIDLTDEKSQDSTSAKESSKDRDRQKHNSKKSMPCPLSKKKLVNPKIVPEKKAKDSQETVSGKSTKRILEEGKQTVVVVEKLPETIPEVSGEDAEKILQNDILVASTSQENPNPNKNQLVESGKSVFDKSSPKKNSEVTEMDVGTTTRNSSMEINQLESLQETEPPTTTVAVEVPVESLREEEAIAMDVSENVETVENGNDNDKISECIARSIDLIDPPVGELMELSGDWGEAHSPKSPISPTQMFLSMFPLLPRESIVNASENQNSTCKTSMQFSSVRSSFFIDAMLPEESSSNTEAVSASSTSANNNSTLPRSSSMNVSTNQNTNVSSNSTSNFISSTYNSLVGTTCLAVAPNPTPQRQETNNFHNLESLNFMSSAPTSTFSTINVSPPKKSSSIESGLNHLNGFRSNAPAVPISNSTSNVNQIQTNVAVPASESPQYKNPNFSQFPSYMHSQPIIQHNRATIPTPTAVSSQNNAIVPQQSQKKHSNISQQSKSSLNSSLISTTTNSKSSSVSTSHVESSSTSSSHPIPIARVTQYQPQMSTSDSHNIFRNLSTPSTTTHGHASIPIAVPTPTPNTQHHVHHHHPYQNPTFHQNPPTPSRNSRESSKTQNYQNSYTGENASNVPQSHSNSNTNAKGQKSQIFRPGLTDFNMSARMHTQIHQEQPATQPSQNYSTNDSSNNNNNNHLHHQSKSHAPTSAPITYPANNTNSLNPHLNLNVGNHHNHSNYPSISTMQPQQSNLQRNASQGSQNQSNSKTHSHSASNSSKQQRGYSHSSELSGSSYSVRPPQQQNESQQSLAPPQNHSTNTNPKSQSQSQHQQHQSHSHSQRSGAQSQSQSQNHAQQHHSSRNQSSKGISSTTSHANNNNSSNNSLSNSSGTITSRNSNNPPENSFHLDFSSAIPTPVPISAQPSLVQISNRNRSNNSSSHSTPIANPLQINPPTIPPPTPIPDFTASPAMNFNQYHHHDPNLHSSSPNYFPIRHPAPPTPTAARATPFYLQEVHSSEALPILSHTPLNNHNTNTGSLQSQNQTNNLNNNSKNNFNPPAPPPPVYSHPTHSHHNKNYFLDHTQGHSLYQHTLNSNVPQPHLQSEAGAGSLVAPPPPPIYSHPVHTPHVSHRHQQPNCNVAPSQHQNQTQQPNVSRPQQHQQQNNKSHSSNNNNNNKQTNNQSQSNQNQTHYPVQQSNSNNSNTNNSNCSSNQQRPNQNASNNNNNNSIVVPPQPNNNSSRPVNWMTDPPHRKPAPVVNNPFSVSKLVGNSSFVTNNSYCAEALIRKNPEWSDFHFAPPPTPTIAPPPPPPQHSHPPHTFVPYQAQNEHPAYSNFSHQYTPNPSATHFGHFDNTQQHHHHPHNHLPHHHATTSSVSNFNLSSIFPEINDKRTNSNNTSSTNANSNPQETNTNNRCNYYSGKITK